MNTSSQSAASPKNPAVVDPIYTVVTRNDYYRDGFRNLLVVTVLGGIAIIGLVMAVFAFVKLHQPKDKYFATTPDGRLIRMVPLSEANLSEAALMSWVAQAATEVMTFGFHDYKRRLQEASRHFTRGGWENFMTALTQSRILEAIDAHKQVVTTTPRSAPVLIQKGLTREGRYFWRVQLPLIVTYQAGTNTRNEYMTIEVTVVRVSMLENPVGVGIDQWIGVLG